jgi:hypothetical protein
MQRPTYRIMNGLKGGDVVMEGPEAGHAVLHDHDSATGAGGTRLQPRLNFSSRIKFFRAKKRRTLSMRGAAVWGRPWWGVSGVWTVSTLWAADWAVPVPDWAGFHMFRPEPSVCRGWNPVRVPPRARVFPVQGLRASECAQPVHLWAPSGAFFVSRCCGRAAPSLTGEAVLLLTHSWAGTPGTA